MNMQQFKLTDNEPVFFTDSFKLPLFNDVMEQELIKALNWLKTQPLDDSLMSDICRIVMEIIDINNTLIRRVDFNTNVKGYSCSAEYKRINSKIQISKPCYVCSKQYTYHNMKDCFFFIMRKMSNCICKEGIANDDYNKYSFLYRFFLDLYADIDLFTGAFE